MVRCVEYYERCERDGCDWCDKDPDTVRTIEAYIKFYKMLEELGVPKKTTIVGLPEFAIRPLIRERDEQVRENAIIKCRDRLIGKTGAGRGNTKNLTEKDIKKIIEDAEIEIRNERIEQELAEEAASPIKTITQAEVDALLGKKEAEPPEPKVNEEGDRLYSVEEVKEIWEENPQAVTVSRMEINIHYEVMKKLGYGSQIPDHKKRVKEMIEQKALLIIN